MRFVRKTTEIQVTIGAETVSVRDGIYTARLGFFYTGGYTAEQFANRVRKAYPTAKILDSGEVWKAFRGGASCAQQSHWFVKFRLEK